MIKGTSLQVSATSRHVLMMLICSTMTWMSIFTTRGFIANATTGRVPCDGFAFDHPTTSTATSSLSPPQHRMAHAQDSYLEKPELKMTPERLAFLRGPDGPKPVVLVTGAAGFVGMHTCLELQRLGMTPIGLDNVNDYYSTDLKELRIQELQRQNIAFLRGDVCDATLVQQLIDTHHITRIIHLAAQAGVRFSLDHPLEYTRNNIDCVVHLLELFVRNQMHKDGTSLIYASSSSVYGNNLKIPFAETDRIEDPASVYAATKRSDELLATTYFNLYNMTSIGLRFFTVYGPYGRPDMAPFLFTDRVSNHQTIKVFNHGQSRRDFTYVDDIVQGVVNSLFVQTHQPELINLGFGRPIVLQDFVNLVEENVGHKAIIQEMGMQKGDVPTTYADISKARYLLGYQPSTPIEEGIAKFVAWFREANAGQYRMGATPPTVAAGAAAAPPATVTKILAGNETTGTTM
jgi:UDP-glucuronate 4-epimerase